MYLNEKCKRQEKVFSENLVMYTGVTLKLCASTQNSEAIWVRWHTILNSCKNENRSTLNSVTVNQTENSPTGLFKRAGSIVLKQYLNIEGQSIS
jgi:hypothetical protein